MGLINEIEMTVTVMVLLYFSNEICTLRGRIWPTVREHS